MLMRRMIALSQRERTMGDGRAVEVNVDAEACVGTGFCISSAPETFHPHPDAGTATLLRTHLTDVGDIVDAEEAALLCPMGAITVTPADDRGHGDA